jgi:hypothetical protein
MATVGSCLQRSTGVGPHTKTTFVYRRSPNFRQSPQPAICRPERGRGPAQNHGSCTNSRLSRRRAGSDNGLARCRPWRAASATSLSPSCRTNDHGLSASGRWLCGRLAVSVVAIEGLLRMQRLTPSADELVKAFFRLGQGSGRGGQYSGQSQTALSSRQLCA